MDKDFWQSKWIKNEIGFHEGKPNDFLVKYFDHIRSNDKLSALLPLCGISQDILWLSNRCEKVTGIEIHKPALERFLVENGITDFVTIDTLNSTKFSFDNVDLIACDFLKFEDQQSFNFIFDRASLVALPKEIRVTYVNKCANILMKGGKILLVSFEYDNSLFVGPPFSIASAEIERLYERNFAIRLLDSSSDFLLDNFTAAIKVYELTRK